VHVLCGLMFALGRVGTRVTPPVDMVALAESRQVRILSCTYRAGSTAELGVWVLVSLL
jgi:hypothetical protein